MGEIESKSGVRIRVNPQLFAVQIHGRVCGNAIELNTHLLTLPIGRSRECLAIPADTGREVSSTRPGKILCLRSSLDAPVVRQVHRTPVGILE